MRKLLISIGRILFASVASFIVIYYVTDLYYDYQMKQMTAFEKALDENTERLMIEYINKRNEYVRSRISTE
jgi:hypothetical protein